MTSPVAVEGLTKRFGSTLALDNVSLEVQQAELFGLLGPDGGGNTTHMDLMAGSMTWTARRRSPHS